MSVLATFLKAVESKDEASLSEVIHEDYKFIPHVNDQVYSKSDMLSVCMSDSFTRHNGRIVYENDEIAVDHAVVSFANGSTSEAVLSVHTIQDGKITSTETGATPIVEDYNVVGTGA